MTFKAAVFDIDGTLAMMDKETGAFTALPGAIEAINTCKAAGMAVVAYTNGTIFTPEHYYAPLARAGIELEPGHMMTPAVVAAHELARLGQKRVMVLAAEGVVEPVREAGVEIVAPKKGAGAVDAVLVGWTRDFDVHMLEAAADALWNGAPLYATSVAPYFASAKGKMMGISGALVAGLQNATGVEHTLFGKPSVAGLTMVSDLTGARPDEMIVIGDDPKLELLMARRAGAFALGVTTGGRDRAAFDAMSPETRAHIVLDTLEDFDLSACQEDFA